MIWLNVSPPKNELLSEEDALNLNWGPGSCSWGTPQEKQVPVKEGWQWADDEADVQFIEDIKDDGSLDSFNYQTFAQEDMNMEVEKLVNEVDDLSSKFSQVGLNTTSDL